MVACETIVPSVLFCVPQIFRETKESELQNQLKARRHLESCLQKVDGSVVLQEAEPGQAEALIGQYPSDAVVHY